MTSDLIRDAWKAVLHIQEIINFGKLKFSQPSIPLNFTLTAIALGQQHQAYQTVTLDVSPTGVNGHPVKFICGTLPTRNLQAAVPQPPFLIFLFDDLGVRNIRFRLDQKGLEWFDGKAWVPVP